MRRAFLAALAVGMMVIGGGLLAVSGWVYAAFGTDGVASASLGEISSAPTSHAVVIDVDSAQVRLPVLPVRGETSIRLRSLSGAPIIAGSSNRTDTDALLGARDIDVAYRVDGQWTLSHVTGLGDQAPWTALPTWINSGPSVDIGVRDGDSLIIANANGSPGVQVEAAVQFTTPKAPLAALMLAICGAIVLLSGVALMLAAIWLMRRRRYAAAD